MNNPPGSKPEVPSNQKAQFGTGIPGIILFPSLGAPTIIAESGNVHLLLLSKKDLNPEEINGRLQIHGDLQSLERVKSPKRPPGSPEEQAPASAVSTPRFPSKLCQNATDLLVEPIEDPEKLIEIEEIGLKGYLNQKILEFWHEETFLEKSQVGHLHHVTIPLHSLEPDLATIASGKKFFLHWSDFGGSDPDKFYQESHERALYEILQKANDGILVGKRLWKDMEDARPAGLGSLACLNANGLVPDQNLLLTDYHPVYRRPRAFEEAPDPGAKGKSKPSEKTYVRGTKPKESLSLAVISDLHLVTKFQILQKSRIRTLNWKKGRFVGWQPGNGETEDSLKEKTRKELESLFPPVGDLMSESVQVLENHFNEIGEQTGADAPEAVLVVGDLIDFHRDCYPNQVGTVLAPKEGESGLDHAKRIWKKVHVPSEFDDEADKAKLLDQNFQFGTSYLGIFHMVADFVRKFTKPVFLIAGNHDGYFEPFGISPRVAFDSKPEAKEFTKANEGIACDSNLTFLEATLAFGPSYGNHLMDKDFDKRVVDLFFLLFCPFRTWSQDLGINQPVVFLDWGDGEMMFMHAEDDKGATQSGHLPHADKAVSTRDLSLLESIAEKATGKNLTVVSHFTYACYNPNTPLVTDCNLRSPQGSENEKSFHDDDVMSQTEDTIDGAIGGALAGVVVGGLLGAGLGAGIGAGVGAGVALARGKDAGDGAADGAGTGAIAGAITGAALGGIVGGVGLGYFSHEAGLNQKLTDYRLPNDYNYGTFHMGRRKMFDLIEKGEQKGISMTISGHAHRAAFYTFERFEDWEEPQPVSSGPPKAPVTHTKIHVRGWHLEEFSKAADLLKPKCLMVVSDSAGPIPRRNQDNVLEGWGSQRPSWTKIAYIKGLKPLSITSQFTSFERARPRLAVALDYLEGTVVRLSAKAYPESSCGPFDILGATYKNKYRHWKDLKPEVPLRELSKLQFPGSLLDGSDKPLWKATPQSMATDDSRKQEATWGSNDPHCVLIEPDKLSRNPLLPGETEEVFRSNILSAFVSDRFDSAFLSKKQPIQLWSNGLTLHLPGGYEISRGDIFFQDVAGNWLVLSITPATQPNDTSIRSWNLKEITMNSNLWNDWMTNFTKSQIPFQSNCWIRYQLSGSGEYDSATPWIVKARIGLYPTQKKNAENQRFRMVIFRDIWPNERPDHANA